MTSILHALFLGALEGLTEFLPISSTGHLIILEELFPLIDANSATFIIAIQLGAILAIVFLFPKIFLNSLKKSEWFGVQNQRIMLAILPALFFGFLFHSAIKEYLFSSKTVAMGLALGAVFMLISDVWMKNRGLIEPEDSDTSIDISKISKKQALTIGLCQCMALWPGMSRSASTIMGGIWSGLSYQVSARFSFIIAVPVMIAAVSYDLFKSAPSLSITDIELIAIGLVTSFIMAIFSVKTFLKILSRFKLAPFAIYRLILVLVLIF